MYSKFPFSLENIPRQRAAGCLSLKVASIVTALIQILYSLFALFQCFTILSPALGMEPKDNEQMVSYGVLIAIVSVHTVSFVLSTLMLLGAMRETASLLKPWVVWKSGVLVASVSLFVLWTAISAVTQAGDSLQLYVLEFLSLVVQFYMLSIVASYHKQLTEEGAETERLRDIVGSKDTWYTEA